MRNIKNYNIKLYIEKVKRFSNKDETIYAANEYAETFVATDKLFKEINSELHKSNYIMYKDTYDILNYVKVNIEYMYFLTKKMCKLNLITHLFKSNAIENSYKYVSDCYKQFNELLDKLPEPDSLLCNSHIYIINLCHKDLYLSFGLDIENPPEDLFVN